MADVRIADLPVLLQADLDATDVLPIDDTSASETKKITSKELVQGGVITLIDNGVIPGAKLVSGSVDTLQLADNSVTTLKIIDGAVTTAKIADSSVTAAKLATDAVTELKILNGAVTSTKLAAGAVTSAALAANAVATTNITDDSVTSAKLAAGAVDTTALAADAVNSTIIQDNAVGTTELANDAVTVDKIAAGAVDTAAIAASAVTTTELADDSVTTAKIVAGAVTNAKLAADSVGNANLINASIAFDKTNFADGSVPGAKIADASITTAKLASNAVDTAALSASSVTTAKVQDNAVTTTKIADDAVTSAKLAAGAVDSAAIATDAVGTTEIVDFSVTAAKLSTGAVTNTKLASSSVGNANLINGSIGFEKTNFADNSVPGAKVTDASITAAKLAADSVTGPAIADRSVSAVHIELNSITNTELASNSVESAEIANNAVTEDKINLAAVTTAKIADAAVTDDKVATGIAGTKLTDDSVTAAKIPTTSLDRGLDKTSGSIGHTNSVTPNTTSGITFDAQGHITATAALVAADLPEATASDIGAVSVPADSGLTVDAAGQISINNTVTAATAPLITFDAKGLVTGSSSLTSADLPLATSSAAGAVIVPTTSGLEVDASGNIFIPDQAQIANAATFTKVTVNEQGIVTAGTTLAAADIPDISAAKLTSGTLSAGRIANDYVTGAMMADSSTAKFGGASDSGGIVVFPTADYKGQFFFDSRNEDLYIYDGNAYQPVTITSGEIIFGGTYDASTNLIASVTTAGQAAGFTAGSALPAASADNLKYYLVVSVSGTGTAPAPAVSLNPPDILLSNGTTYDLLEVSSFVASQQANNISYTPQGSIASTNVQTAITELDTEKLPKAGGTITGALEISETGSLVFEGATADPSETTIGVVDPTADRTINFPDVSGTVVTTGDTGTVTSTMITDATIVDGDISATAGISYSKLAPLTDAHLLIGNSSNVATVTPVTGDVTISNSGVTAITAGSIVNADISATAAIAGSKIVSGTTSVVGVVQLNDTTTSTSTTQAATANAVRTTKIVADAALSRAGGTITGELLIGNTGTFKFEGATDNAFETRLTVVDPTADRLITFQDSDGTVAFTSQLDDGTY